MKHPSPFMERLIAIICLSVAFLVMASVFSPGPSVAGDGHDEHHPAPGHEGGGSSSDVLHQQLRSLGTIEDNEYLVHIYATGDQPLYTVIDRADGSEIATLMTAEEVANFFPDLPIPEIDFKARVQLMLVDPDSGHADH